MKSLLISILVAHLAFSITTVAQDSNDAKPKSAGNPIVSIRLKKLTKDLDLTDEQQKKIRTLLDEEAMNLSSVRENSKISLAERSAKIKEAQQATNAKMKPLLTEPQLEKFEKMLAAMNKPKKK